MQKLSRTLLALTLSGGTGLGAELSSPQPLGAWALHNGYYVLLGCQPAAPGPPLCARGLLAGQGSQHGRCLAVTLARTLHAVLW
jgi:hypothetical protein